MLRKRTEQVIQLKVVRSPQLSSLALVAESLYLSREAMRCTPATLIWYRKYVGALIEYLAERGVQNVDGMTTDHLRAFLVCLQNRCLADTTIHHHASAARTFCNYLVEEELLADSPVRK
jgi:site-specific recombinase XerC